MAELRPSLRGGLHSHLDRAIGPQSTCVDELGRLRTKGVAATAPTPGWPGRPQPDHAATASWVANEVI